MKGIVCSGLPLLLLAGMTALRGQDVSGTIGGTILDPTGAAVPDAKISVTDTDRNQVVRTVKTESSGSYAAPFLPVGVYSIKVEAPGFKNEERKGVVLNVNDDLKFNFTLQVGAPNETIEVTADAAAVELGSAADATTIEGRQITELSLATRNYESLVALMPGVAPNSVDDLYVGSSLPSGSVNTVPFSINGMRNSANNWTVDGADNVDRGSNQTLQTFPSVDGIQQFKVERGMYTADTGRAGGAQINVVTRGGAQKFHGSFYEFFRNDALNANTWSNNANSVNLVNGVAKAPPVRWNDYSSRSAARFTSPASSIKRETGPFSSIPRNGAGSSPITPSIRRSRPRTC